MRILEKEIGLREQTRGVEQARGGLESDVFAARATELADTQRALGEIGRAS